jgi:hypothetical protein
MVLVELSHAYQGDRHLSLPLHLRQTPPDLFDITLRMYNAVLTLL